jgi:hypothetical protein
MINRSFDMVRVSIRSVPGVDRDGIVAAVQRGVDRI